MAVPLYEAKADLFRTLGHPTRIRVLELLADHPMVVKDLLGELEVEASNLSQQLAVLRRAGVVKSTRQGASVVYSVNSPAVPELLAAARTILAHVWGESEGMLNELRGTT